MGLNTVLYGVINIEYITYFYTFFGKRPKKQHMVKYLIGSLFWFMLFLIAIKTRREEIVNIFAILSSIIAVFIIYGLSMGKTLELFFLGFSMLSILENIIEYILHYCIEINEEYITIAYTVIIICLMWIYYILLGRKIDKDAFSLPAKLNLVVGSALLIVVAMLSYFSYTLTEVLHFKQGIMGLGLITVGSGLIFLLIIIMIYYFNVQHKYQLENKILEKYNEQQRRYFECLLEKEQKTRQFRHDIISELMQIKNYCNKQKYSELDKYIDETLKEISGISRYDYDIGNEIINILLNYYLLPMNNKCVVDVKGYISDSLDISRRDLCIIVSNLLKNAIEAVEKLPEKDRYILFDIKNGNRYLQLKVKNTCIEMNENTSSIKKITTKEDKINHGFGIKNIENIVHKYEGEITFKCEKNIFEAELIIKSNHSSIN